MSVLKYKREEYFLKSIKDKVSDFMLTPAHSTYHLKHQIKIYNLTRPALKVNHLENIKEILKKINLFFHDSEHDIDKFLRIYIVRQSTPEALATSANLRGYVTDDTVNYDTRFYVIMSQHFMNELEPEEQLALIAHEYAHHYFAHTSIPYSSIVDQYKYIEPIDPAHKMFILNVKKWGMCREISADLCALQLTKSYKASALALIKFALGTTKNAEQILNGLEKYFEKLKNHYQSDVLKEHPTTLLRVLILKKVWEYCDENKWSEEITSDDIQDIIDEQIMLVYPEIIHNRNKHNMRIILDLGLLVAIADGEIDDNELEFLKELLKSQQAEKMFKNFNKKVAKYKTALNDFEPGAEGGRRKEADKIIKKDMPIIISRAKDLNESGTLHISSIIRNLLTLAKADRKIDRYELGVIYLFAKEFNYTKEDIVQQMFNL